MLKSQIHFWVKLDKKDKGKVMTTTTKWQQ